MEKDTIAGKVKETGGKVRRNVGEMTGDREGQARGAKDQISGKVQKNWGKLKDSLD